MPIGMSKQAWFNTITEPIVKDGLIFRVDAGNDLSYPGSGTTLTDLGPNAFTGTLTNGPTFDPNNAGSIVFDGVDDYVTFSDNDALDINSSFSLLVWFKGNPTQSGGQNCGIFNKENTNNFGNYGFYGDFNNDYVRFGFRDTTATQREVSNASYSDIKANTWVNYTGTYNFSQLKLYRNGVEIASGNFSNTPQVNGRPLTLGARTLSDRYFTGNISIGYIYNRALSPEEVEQNFNAIKYRYGI